MRLFLLSTFTFILLLLVGRTSSQGFTTRPVIFYRMGFVDYTYATGRTGREGRCCHNTGTSNCEALQCAVQFEFELRGLPGFRGFYTYNSRGCILCMVDTPYPLVRMVYPNVRSILPFFNFTMEVRTAVNGGGFVPADSWELPEVVGLVGTPVGFDNSASMFGHFQMTLFLVVLAPGRSGMMGALECIETNELICDPRTGVAFCKNGLSGPTCEDAFRSCIENPCQNDGLCHVSQQTFYCECTNEWEGQVCELKRCGIDTCHRGVCLVTAAPRCNCAIGFSGSDCSNEFCDPRDPNFCRNGGKCVKEDDLRICECDPKVSYGRNCEQQCTLPCANGFCREISGTPTCDCDVGFTGVDCSIVSSATNPCAFLPCENGGICRQNTTDPTDYSCTCNDFYTGKDCERLKCDATNCFNGLCLDGSNCKCFDGYTGEQCNQPTCTTYSDRCMNGGTCQVAESLLQCRCTDEYAGEFCQVRCLPQCMNGGYCTIYNNRPLCRCSNGWTGDDCGQKIPENVCNEEICRNGGRCTPSMTDARGYTCDCQQNFSGDNCEIPICDFNYCIRGVCLNGIECLCVPNFIGPNCDTATCDDYDLCQNGGECFLDGPHRITCKCDPSSHTGNFCEIECETKCQNGVCQLIDGLPKCQCNKGYFGAGCASNVEFQGDQVAFIVLIVFLVLLVLAFAPIGYFMHRIRMENYYRQKENKKFIHPNAARKMVPDATGKVEDTYQAVNQLAPPTHVSNPGTIRDDFTLEGGFDEFNPGDYDALNMISGASVRDDGTLEKKHTVHRDNRADRSTSRRKDERGDRSRDTRRGNNHQARNDGGRSTRNRSHEDRNSQRDFDPSPVSRNTIQTINSTRKIFSSSSDDDTMGNTRRRQDPNRRGEGDGQRGRNVREYKFHEPNTSTLNLSPSSIEASRQTRDTYRSNRNTRPGTRSENRNRQSRRHD